jgi:NAD(P)-dependent dehydrogenase (short-subunit alcohol dehydrogenase family)
VASHRNGQRQGARLRVGRNAGDRVLAVDLDVELPHQIEAAVAAAKERFGRIDVLVNNAGYGYQSTAEEDIDSEIRAQFEANVFGLFAMTRAVLPIMRAQRSGHIINITSVAGLIGFPGSGYYAASKHAVEGFSDSLSAEVEPLGIAVTCVEPYADCRLSGDGWRSPRFHQGIKRNPSRGSSSSGRDHDRHFPDGKTAPAPAAWYMGI